MSHFPRIVIDGIVAATGDGVFVLKLAEPERLFAAVQQAIEIITDASSAKSDHPLASAWYGGDSLLGRSDIPLEDYRRLCAQHDADLAASQIKRDLTAVERRRFSSQRNRLYLAMLAAGYPWMCAECGSREHLTIDHIVPLSHGGSDELKNLRFLCRSCNSRKSDKAVRS